MDDPGKKEFLKKTSVFSSLSDSELDEVAPLMTRRSLRSDTVIFHENDPAAAFYMVRYGRVKIYTMSREGREQILAILGSGQIFGDVPVFDGGPYPASAAAMADSEIYLIKSQDFQELLRRYPEIAIKVIRVLGQRLRQSMELVRDLSFKQVPHRLAGLLLKLARDHGMDTGEGIQVDLAMSRQSIADTIGTSRETVTRELKKMEQAGIISINRRVVRITNLERLTDWAR